MLSFVSLLPRPVPLRRHIGNFQQSRDLSMASIQAERCIEIQKPARRKPRQLALAFLKPPLDDIDGATRRVTRRIIIESLVSHCARRYERTWTGVKVCDASHRRLELSNGSERGWG